MSAENKIILIFSILFLIVIVLFFISIVGRGELIGWAKVPDGSTGNDACPIGYKCMFVGEDFADLPPSQIDESGVMYGCKKVFLGGDDWAFCVKK